MVRLKKSVERIKDLFPLDEVSIANLTEDQEESVDAFLHRFSSLAASIQDHVGRALLSPRRKIFQNRPARTNDSV